MTWTTFWDMHSGGGQKEDFAIAFIEAPEDEAKLIFYNRFGHSPDGVSCTCCGSDYSVSESESLEQATGYHRGCDGAYFDSDGNEVEDIPYGDRKAMGKLTFRYVERPSKRHRLAGDYRTLNDYVVEDGVLVIYDEGIADDERVGEIPEQGYVWVD